MNGETLRILDPRAFPSEPVADAPRLSSLEGVTIALLWNNRPKGDVILRAVGEELQSKYGAQVLFRQKLRVGTGAPEEVIAGIAKEASAAVVGVGD